MLSMTPAPPAASALPRGTRREIVATLAASFISLLGDQLARLAMAVLVLERTHSAALSALAYALTMLPAVAGGALLGGLADRLPRRRVMVAADLARAALIVVPSIPGCPLGLAMSVVALIAFVEAGFDGARAALVADLAGDRYLPLLAWDRLVNQSAQLLGFATGGVVLVAVGARLALLGDAATFLISAALLLLLVRAHPRPVVAGGSASPLRRAVRDAVDGARHVLETAARRRPLQLACLVAAAAVLPEGLAAAYARELGYSGGATAILMLANPLGTIGSAAWMARSSTPANDRRVRIWVAVALLPLIALAAGPPLPVVVALLVCSGVGMAASLISRAVFTAEVAPEMRGRAFAFAGALLTVTQGGAVALGGVVAQASGDVHLTLASAAAGALVVATVLTRRTSDGRTMVDDPGAHSDGDGLELGVGFQLGQQRLDVVADRVDADEEPVGDLAVGEPERECPQHV